MSAFAIGLALCSCVVAGLAVSAYARTLWCDRRELRDALTMTASALRDLHAQHQQSCAEWQRDLVAAIEAQRAAEQDRALMAATVRDFQDADVLRLAAERQQSEEAASLAEQQAAQIARAASELAQFADFVEEQGRIVFRDDCGLNVESYAPNFDLSRTGKFNDFIHALAARLRVDRPVGTVDDVIRAFVRGLA